MTLTDLLLTIGSAMLPVLELRFALPYGLARGLSPAAALIASIVGNMIPVPFIILLVRPVFTWLRLGILRPLVEKLERRAHDKSDLVRKYSLWGLMILVAIPLPGTGAWTGALVAAFLDLRLKSAVPAIFAGVVLAGLLVLGISMGVISLF